MTNRPSDYEIWHAMQANGWTMRETAKQMSVSYARVQAVGHLYEPRTRRRNRRGAT